MAGKFYKTRFPGVFYRETKTDTGETDKTYVVNVPDDEGRRHWKTVGSHSQGMRPNAAATIRAAIVAEIDTVRREIPPGMFACGKPIGDDVAGSASHRRRNDGFRTDAGKISNNAPTRLTAAENRMNSRCRGVDGAVHAARSRGGGSETRIGSATVSIRMGTDENATAVQSKTAFTIGQAVEEYCAWARSNGKAVDRILRQYDIHCRKSVHNHPIDAFAPSKAEKLKASLFRSGLAAQSVHHLLAFLRRACNLAVGTERAIKNPFVAVRGGVFSMPKLDNARTRYLTPIEADMLLQAIRRRSETLYIMSFTALHTGLRAPEIFRLRREDIDAAAGCLRVHAKMSGKAETAYAPQAVISMLMSIPVSHPHDLLFPDRNGGIRKETPKTFNRCVEELGIQREAGSDQRITFHVFRHTFASWLAQSGDVTLHELEALMRHHSLEMTQRYAHLIPSATARKIDLIGSTLSRARPARHDDE